jgi:hypothetical protein
VANGWLNAVAGNGSGTLAAVGNTFIMSSTDNGVTWVNRSTVSQQLLAVAYGNGLFVAVGLSGIMRTSPDGITWSAATSGVTDTISAVRYGGGKWVATTTAGKVLTSTTGTSGWTYQTLASGLYAGVYGNGLWVAASSAGNVYTSPDASAWTQRATSTTQTLNCVAYGGGTFIAGGTSGGITESTDGITWTSATSGTSLSLNAAAASPNSAPNAPPLNSPATNQPIDRGIVQRFAWTFSDPDPGDSQSAFDLQYRLVGAGTWTTVSGATPNAFYDFAASTFTAGNYEWQVRTYDSQGVVGPFSASSFFTAATAPPAPTITAPVNGSTVQATATLTWSAPNQTDYQIRRVADNAGSADTSTVYYDSGDVVDGVTRSVSVAFPTNNRWEHVQVRIKNAGLWSTWADARVQVSFTPPTVAAFTMSADPATATRTLTITNPAPGTGVPATAYNDVYVRTAASSTVLDTYRPYSATGVRIGTALPTNTPFIDRRPAGDPVVYEYRVVAIAVNQTTSDSGWVATP